MNDTTIIDRIISEGIASNVFQAGHIANGLHLAELHTDPDAQIKRARLYRDWRNAGESSKVAYLKAIAGETVPPPMFEEVLHSEFDAEWMALHIEETDEESAGE
jgi:hypothetical protein